MEASIPRTRFDSAYETGFAPWVIGEPQPAIIELERAGLISGSVLDPGCGTGEHTILLTKLGYDVIGIDFSPRAIEKARANAAEHGVAARFEVADAMELGDLPPFDTIVDSALFHIFGPEERVAYTRSLHAACRPGGLVHVLALSNTDPGIGPRIGDDVIRDVFTEGWDLESLEPSSYRGVFGEEDARRAGLETGTISDATAWLARARRL
ncbi:class I SAM-dependent methyltransferase [Saccharopolyspora taberi]|uniref:Class I SAM-dependent methyltransferase n=1 Tax=Saccharopolyspora taberi TaxID=60895 RepID=A0ABN3VH14_9PSEU